MLLALVPLLGLVAMVGAIWTALDAARRGQNWFAWSVLVAVTGVALVAWLLARRRFPLVESRRTWTFGAELMLGILFIVALDALLGLTVSAFLFQNARVEGAAMSPTVNNQDRLIVDKSVYRRQGPRRGDVVMLYYQLNPDRTFVKRVIAEEGDQIRIVNGHVYTNDVPINDPYVPAQFRSHDDYGPQVVPRGYYLAGSGRADGTLLIDTTSPDQSALLLRMRSRRPSSQMPPLGTVVQDQQAIDAIRAWISSLPDHL